MARSHSKSYSPRQIFDLAPMGILIAGADARIIDVNPALCRLLGYSADELKGRHLGCIATEPKEVIEKHIGQALSGEERVSEVINIRKEREPIDLAIREVGIVLEDGTPAVLVMSHDLRELKRAERALRDSEERLELALKGTDLGLWDWDVENDRLFIDEQLAQMLGYRRDELPRSVQLWEELNHPDEAAEIDELFAAHLRGETETFQSEHRMRTKSGSWKWILDQGKVVRRDVDGKPLRMTGTHKDIDDRRSAEERARELEAELAHMTRLTVMGELMAGVTHEISQPLYAIANYASACLNRLDGSDIDRVEIREFARRISDQANRAGMLLRTMLGFVRHSTHSRDCLDVNELIRESIGLVEYELRRRHIVINCQLSAENLRVEGGRVELQQAFVSLFRNAWEACEESEADGVIRVSSARKGSGVEILVEDNGPGFQQDNIAEAFEAFVTHKLEGIGMGLAVSKTIVRAYDGTISASNRPDRGALVRVWLPAAQ